MEYNAMMMTVDICKDIQRLFVWWYVIMIYYVVMIYMMIIDCNMT